MLTGRAASAAPIIPGDLVVTRVAGGTTSVSEGSVGAPGSAALSGSGVTGAVFIDEYTALGNASYSTGNTITLPYNSTMVSGSSRMLTFSGTQNSEGAISLSGDGQFLAVAGYNQSAFVAGVSSNGSPATTVNRVVGIVGLDGSVDTTTALQDASSAQPFRSAYTSDGNSIYVNGANGGNVTVSSVTYTSSGIRYTTKGSTTSTQIQALSAGGHRSLGNALGAGLYVANTGTPTGNRGVNLLPGFGVIQQLTGFGVGSDATSDFWFADSQTIYTADVRTDGTNGGVRKWRFEDTNADTVADTWVFKYVVTLGTQAGPTLGGFVGAGGITGVNSNGIATIYATTFDGTGANQNKLVTLTDLVAGTGNNVTDQAAAAASLFTIATSPSNNAFRGVEFIPEPSTISLLSLGALGLLRRGRRA